VNFTENDIKQIESKGLSVEKVQSQIQLFRSGIPFVTLKDAATIGNGIVQISKDLREHYINFFDSKRTKLKLLKFVPASGAATRMFKFLFQFLENYDPNKESINSYINRNKDTNMSLFLIGIEKLPFYQVTLEKAIDLFPDFKKLSSNNQTLILIKTLLEEDKLNLSYYPKGLLPFHKYKDHNATAFEEHLFEAALYASSKDQAELHFTISERHNHKFDEEFKRIEEIVESKTNTAFNITFSFQKESTDTISVTTRNDPFRDPNGQLVFRPSGHGALLENLNALEADVVFIKNIDNVVVFKYEEEVSNYKKLLAGILLETQEEAFKYVSELLNDTLSEEQLVAIAQFLADKLNVVITSEFEKYSTKYQREFLLEKLNRPIRVCGMVKNEGEPGGGPFWVKNESGNISLQIVESAQVDKKNKVQKTIMKNATHFNPVDLVCGIKNYKGDKFDLTQFTDPKTAFISMKTKTGKNLKALELPGLWNGSMANWNTIFVEVPLITFNPVKTVNDLLKSQHQVK
jgi:hypothetical protein